MSLILPTNGATTALQQPIEVVAAAGAARPRIANYFSSRFSLPGECGGRAAGCETNSKPGRKAKIVIRSSEKPASAPYCSQAVP